MRSGLLLFLSAASAQAAPAAFSSLYEAALIHSPVLAIARADARRAGYDKDRALAGFLPRVDVQGGAQGWSQGNQNSPLGSQVRPNSQEAWELRAEETVFAGGGVMNRYRASGSGARAAEYENTAKRQALLHDVGFWGLKWLEAQEVLKQTQAELERRQGHRDAAKKRVAAGDLSETDSIRAEAEVQNAVSEKLEAERAALEARSRLETMTGLDLSPGVEPPPPLPLPAEGREDLGQSAGSNNPQALAGQENLRAAEFQTWAERGRLLPSIAVGGATRGTREAPQSLLFVERETYGFVEARWALFSGGERLASAKSARTAAARTAEELRQTRDAQSLNARLALDAAKSAEAAIAAESARMDSAVAAYDRVRKRFDAGLDPYLNLLDASTALKSAEASLIRTRYARERAALDLYWALGSLEEAVLKTS